MYHYTDGASLDKIAASGTLHASRFPGDCALGEGVYATAKRPVSSTAALLRNNYGNASISDRHRVEAYVRLDADKVAARSGRDQLGRDVHVVAGGDLSLAGVDARFGRR